jgi:hypothetical protein
MFFQFFYIMYNHNMSNNSNQSDSPATQCPPGQILRKGFTRKAYERKGYINEKTGAYVKPASVGKTKVPASCVKHIGKGKPPILPKPDKKIQLHKYGYSIRKSSEERHTALKKAAADNDLLVVLKRLNLIRNLQPIEANKKIFTADVEYLSNLYAKQRARHGPSRRSYGERLAERKRNNAQKGAGDDDFESSEQSDNVVDKINLPETSYISVDTKVDMEKICNNGKCNSNIFESHKIDNTEIIFYTLTEADANNILKLDKIYLNANQNKSTVSKIISDNEGLLIGVKYDNQLQGYCQFKPHLNDTNVVDIVWFCANKTYGTPLYKFVEAFFATSGYTIINTIVTMENPHAVRILNFWYLMEFRTYKVDSKELTIYLEKAITK